MSFETHNPHGKLDVFKTIEDSIATLKQHGSPGPYVVNISRKLAMEMLLSDKTILPEHVNDFKFKGIKFVVDNEMIGAIVNGP